MRPRVLVAGAGNIFLGDDGFGPEVARRLARESLPEWVRVQDFGIRGVHLAYEMLDGYDTLILIDAAPRDEAPGTVYVIEPELPSVAPHDPGATGLPSPVMDAHGMEPESVLSLLEALGGRVDRVIVVGCEPAGVEEGIGLSEPVERAVETAVRVVKDLIEKEATGSLAVPGTGTLVDKQGKE
jgi:hydrogenase maturation protease